MIDIKKKWGTRSGFDVRLVSDQGHPDVPIIGYIGNSVEPTCWDCDGGFPFENDDFDLVEVKEKKVMYVNVYDDGELVRHVSSKSAKNETDGTRIACIRVEYEEGQFDD